MNRDKRKTAKTAKPDIPFRDHGAAGREGFDNITDLQFRLDGAQLSLADDASYRRAGLRGFRDLQRRAARHAMAVAASCYRAGCEREKQDAPYTFDTLHTLPYAQYELAYEWLLKTDRPLFADKTYAPFGLGADGFFARIQQGHLDAVKVKMELARDMLADNPEDLRPCELVKSVFGFHFARLGIGTDITPFAARALPMDVDDIEDIRYDALRAQVRGQLRIASGLRFKGHANPAYCDALLDVHETFLGMEALEYDPDVWENTNFNAKSYAAELARAMDARIDAELKTYNAPGLDRGRINGVLENMDKWRRLFDEEAEKPEDTPPERIDEDYWNYPIFCANGFRSYSRFMDVARRRWITIAAGETIVQAAKGHEYPAELHDSFVEVQAMLKDCRIWMDRDSAMEDMRFDRDAFEHCMNATSPHAAARDWSHCFDLGQTTENRIHLVTLAMEAANRIASRPEAAQLPESFRYAQIVADDLHFRRAEENLARARICINDEGVYPKLKAAFADLENLDSDIYDPHFQGRAGIDNRVATGLESLYERLDIVNQWREALAKTDTPIIHHNMLEDFFDAYEVREADEQAEILAMITETKETLAECRIAAARAALRECAGRMEARANDTMAMAEYMLTVRNCLLRIDADALADPAAFAGIAPFAARYTLKEFLAFEKAVKSRAERLRNAPTALPAQLAYNFDIAAAELMRARDPVHAGEDAYEIVRKAARDINITGWHIDDPALLGKACMTPESLAEFVSEQAIIAAGELVHRAICKGGMAVTADNLSDHAYHDYLAAYRWIMRSSKFTLLNDQPYQAMGLGGRADFQDRMRESLENFVSQMQGIVLNSGVSMGPLKYLQMMEAIRDGQIALGLSTVHDNYRPGDQTRLADTVTVPAVRQSIHSLGYAAAADIIGDNGSISAKYNRLSGLFSFAARMNADTWNHQARTEKINDEYTLLIRDRIKNVLDLYAAKRPDDPSRGWRIAAGIDDMRRKHGLDHVNWFDGLFQEIGYQDFADFMEHMVVTRMAQLYERAMLRLGGRNAMEAAGDDYIYLEALADLGGIRDILNSPLVQDDRVHDMLAFAGIDEDTLNLEYRSAAAVALPWLARQAADPTLYLDERIDIILDCFHFRELVGRENPRAKTVDWNRLEELHTQAALQLGASFIFTDMMRGRAPQSMSMAILNAGHSLGRHGLALDNLQVLCGMGLNAQEAAHYKSLCGLSVPYELIRQLETIDRADIQGIYDTLVEFHTHARRKGMNLRDPKILDSLGLRSMQEFRDAVDGPALGVLAQYFHDLRFLEKPSDALTQIASMIGILDLTGLEQRISADELNSASVPDRIALNGMALQLKVANSNAPAAGPV